jgi:DeoR family fructose operon transcriptional repressor
MIIARKLKTRGFTVYVTGGEFKLTTDAFIGLMTRETISRFTFDMGFFGCNGVDLEMGLTTPDYEEAIVKQTAMEHSRKVYVLADHSKFGIKTGVKFHDLLPNEIITDSINDQRFKKKGIMIAK